MITTALVGALAFVFTVGSYVNVAGNTTNLAYDKEVVGESLAQMEETARILKEKAQEEQDPDKRAQKLLIAEKLSQTHEKMDTLQDQMIVRTARKEFANLVKGTVVGNLDRISQIGELGGQIAGTIDGSIDTAVSIRAATTKGTVDDITMWKTIAKSGEGIDVEIAKVKARVQAKELSSLNDDLAAMIRDMDAREKAQEITSDEYEAQLGALVQKQPQTFGFDEQDALAGLDTDADLPGDTASQNNDTAPTTALFQPVDPEGIRGDWIITSWAGKPPTSASASLWRIYRFRFAPDGTGKRMYSGLDILFSYTVKSNGIGYITATDFATEGLLTRAQIVEKKFFPELDNTYCMKLENDQTLYIYRTPTCDLDSPERYILKRPQ